MEVAGAPPDAPHVAEIEVQETAVRKVARKCIGRLKDYTLREHFVGPERAGETIQALTGCGNEVLAWPDQSGPFQCEYCSGQRDPIQPLNTREMIETQKEANLYELVDRVLERAGNYLGRCPDCRKPYEVRKGKILHPGTPCWPHEAERR